MFLNIDNGNTTIVTKNVMMKAREVRTDANVEVGVSWVPNRMSRMKGGRVSPMTIM